MTISNYEKILVGFLMQMVPFKNYKNVILYKN